MTKKVYRFIKETIKSMDWHFNIELTEGKYILWKGHVRKDDYKIFKEEQTEITKEDAFYHEEFEVSEDNFKNDIVIDIEADDK